MARELLGRAPRDGRYYVAWLVNRDGQTCLLSEQPATRTEAQTFLQQLGSDYRTRPQRISEYSMDALDGVWVAQRRGFPEALLNIIHPDFIEMAGNKPRHDIGYVSGQHCWPTAHGGAARVTSPVWPAGHRQTGRVHVIPSPHRGLAPAVAPVSPPRAAGAVADTAPIAALPATRFPPMARGTAAARRGRSGRSGAQ